MANMKPIVHPILEKSSGKWQYVVADQLSRHCVVINPVYGSESDKDPEETGASTATPDDILNLIRRREYIVDWLLETQPTSNVRTAVYYLRMQLYEMQGFPPRTCGGTNVSSLRRIFARKYGNKSGFTTSYDEELEDGSTLDVGNMRVAALLLDGPQEQHRAFVIGEYLFGVHYFTHLRGLEHIASNDNMDNEALRLKNLWLSMARVLSYPTRCRIYFDDNALVTATDGPFTTIHDQRSCNRYANMSDTDFIGYWKARRRDGQGAERPKSRSHLFARNSSRAATPSSKDPSEDVVLTTFAHKASGSGSGLHA